MIRPGLGDQGSSKRRLDDILASIFGSAAGGKANSSYPPSGGDHEEANAPHPRLPVVPIDR